MQTSNSEVALAITGLNKKYGEVPVLTDLALTISRGAIHGLVGLNGSGKTTTIECILGLQRFQSGSIALLGYAPDKLHLANGKIVAIFDTPSLHPNLTIRQNLELARLLCDAPVRTSAEVEKLLGVTRYSNYKIKQLSLGNKRRASIAQALLGNPELVILDEPFNGLDAEGVDDVLGLIQQLNRDAGTTFLLCSHQLPYLEQVCSHIAILHKGQIAVSGSITELLGNVHNVALLKTDQIELAQQLLEKMPSVNCEGLDSAGYLRIDLGDLSSSALNQQLVEQQIPVSELHLQRASLTGLFRKINSEGQP